uniref:Fe2OG dioxygenase domain-containing protein n=1 Tax=Kalanchoe fedtschenkoi TaxID=63787 RepID=A0A7N0TEE9_KALFE
MQGCTLQDIAMASPAFQTAKEAAPISLTPKYILPEHERPHLTQVSSSSSIPLIDLQDYLDGRDHDHVVHAVSRACEEYGFFQIINHGVPEELCNSLMDSAAAFFQLPPTIRAQLLNSPVEEGWVFGAYQKVAGLDDQFSMWGESFAHLCDLSGDSKLSQIFHKHAPKYREAIGEYARQMDVLIKCLLGLMSLGLGLEKECLESKIGENYVLRATTNYYPPCPDPELSMGLHAHTDPGALTVLRQSEHVAGLQVLKDEKWVWVEPLPNAFVVNVGDQIQVLSNGKYKSVRHRAVTNKESARVSLPMFYIPNIERVIEPIQELINAENPPLYRKYKSSEYSAELQKQMGTRWRVMETFELQPNKDKLSH